MVLVRVIATQQTNQRRRVRQAESGSHSLTLNRIRAEEFRVEAVWNDFDLLSRSLAESMSRPGSAKRGTTHHTRSAPISSRAAKVSNMPFCSPTAPDT